MQALIDFSGTLRSESPPSEGSLGSECRYEVMIETSTDAGAAAAMGDLRGMHRTSSKRSKIHKDLTSPRPRPATPARGPVE